MRGPGVPVDKRVSVLTGNIDLAATIVDAAEAKPRRILDGASLRELARNPGAFTRRAIMLENWPEAGVRRRWYDAIRKDGYKYVEYRSGARELYDLVSDPFEERSVHDDPRYSGVRSQLADELQPLRHCAGATCRR